MSDKSQRTDAPESKAKVNADAAADTKATPTTLRDAAAKTKATGQKVLGAPVSWWGKRSKRLRLGLLIGVPTTVVLVGVAVFLVLFLRPAFAVAVQRAVSYTHLRAHET